MKKPSYLLLGILLLFVVIYFVLIQKEQKAFSPGKVENFFGLDSALVDRIEFGKFGSKLVFRNISQRWHAVQPDSYRADNQAIGQLLSAASHLEVGEVISSNKAKQLVFQVDTLTGTRLDFFAGENQLASVVIGKMSSDYLHSYVRKTDSDDVYLATGLLSHMAGRRADQWRDRSILTFDPNQITEIELEKGKEKFRLTRDDTLWLSSQSPYDKSSQADGQAVEEYLRVLAEMKADNFAGEPEIQKIDFEKPKFLLKLTFLDGHEETLSAVQKTEDENRYFVRTDQEKTVFVLFKSNFERLAKALEDFRPKEET